MSMFCYAQLAPFLLTINKRLDMNEGEVTRLHDFGYRILGYVLRENPAQTLPWSEYANTRSLGIFERKQL